MEDISQSSKEVAKGSIWALSGQVFFKLLSFFYTILVARMASQGDIGLFYLALGVVTIVSVISHFGVPLSLQRYVPFFEGKGEGGKSRRLLKLGYISGIVLGIILSIIVWLSADIIGGLYQNTLLPEAVRMFAVFLLLNNLFHISLSFLQGRADIKSMQLIYNLQNLFKLILTIVLFWAFGPSVNVLIAGFLGSFLLAILAGIPFVRRDFNSLPEEVPIPQKQLLHEMLPFGMTLTVVAYFSVIINTSDKLILGYMVDPASTTELVAIYTFATTLATVLTIFPGAIGNIFLPVMSRLAGAGDLTQMRSVTEAAQRWALFITIPIGMFMMAFSSDMLTVLYGESYAPGAAAMVLFTLGLLFYSYSSALSYALAALRLVRIELKVSAITAIINIILNIALIPFLGMEGAAMASAASFLIMLALLCHYAGISFGFKIHPSIVKMAGAGILSLIILLVLHPYASSASSMLPTIGEGDLQVYSSKIIYLGLIGVLVALSTALFMGFSLMLKCFRREDVILMKKAMSRANAPALAINLAESVALRGVPDRE